MAAKRFRALRPSLDLEEVGAQCQTWLPEYDAIVGAVEMSEECRATRVILRAHVPFDLVGGSRRVGRVRG